MKCAHAAVARSLNIVTVQCETTEDIIMMELSDVRNELDRIAGKLSDFRGSL